MSGYIGNALSEGDIGIVCATPEHRIALDRAFLAAGINIEAAEAVRAFHPKVVYPYHYKGSDVKAFEKALEGSGVEVRLRNWYPG